MDACKLHEFGNCDFGRQDQGQDSCSLGTGGSANAAAISLLHFGMDDFAFSNLMVSHVVHFSDLGL